MNFRNTITNTIEEVIFPNYDQSIRVIRHVKLPSAYAVPTDKTLLIKVLHNHGFVAGCTGDSKLYATEGYFIQSLKPPKGDDKPASEIKVIVLANSKI